MRGFFLGLAIALFWSTQLHAQEHHSKAQLVLDQERFSSGMRVGIHLELDEGWHTYWENPGDVGAPPEMDISSKASVSQSPLIYSIPIRIKGSPYDFYGL